MTTLLISMVVCFLAALLATRWTRGKLDRRENNQAAWDTPLPPEGDYDTPLPTLPTASGDWRSSSHWDELMAAAAALLVVWLATSLGAKAQLAEFSKTTATWSPERIADFGNEVWRFFLQADIAAAGAGLAAGVWSKIQPRLRSAWASAPEKTKKEVIKGLTAWLKVVVPALLGLGILWGIWNFVSSQIPGPILFLLKWVILLGIPFHLAKSLFFGGGGAGGGGFKTALKALDGIGDIFLGASILSGGKKAAAKKPDEDLAEEKKAAAKRRADALRERAIYAEDAATEAEAAATEAEAAAATAGWTRDDAKAEYNSAAAADKAAAQAALRAADAAAKTAQTAAALARARATSARQAANRAADAADKAETALL